MNAIHWLATLITICDCQMHIIVIKTIHHPSYTRWYLHAKLRVTFVIDCYFCHSPSPGMRIINSNGNFVYKSSNLLKNNFSANSLTHFVSWIFDWLSFKNKTKTKKLANKSIIKLQTENRQQYLLISNRKLLMFTNIFIKIESTR